MLLSLFAKFGLLLGFPGTYAIIIIIGFLCFNEKIYGTTLFLLFFTMIYNYYLKSIWQMPFPPPMEGWAFPSGHTHSAIIFWGWLACQYRKPIYFIAAFLIICWVGFGLVHEGYHYPKDVFGAVGFGLGSLFIYYLLNRLTLFKQRPYLLGILLTLLSAITMLLLPVGTLKPHLWQALGGLIGFTLGWFYLQTKPPITLTTVKQKVLVTSAAFIGIGVIFLVLYLLPIHPDISIFAKMFAITLWVSTLKLTMRRWLKLNA